jgi:hypothetical protein
MPKAKNALAPEVTGANKLLDWVAQKVNPQWFPTAGRTLLETVQGVRDPITEANFSPEEQAFLRQLIEFKGGDKGAVTYKDYQALQNKLYDEGQGALQARPSIFSLVEPFGNIQTTLGQFSYARDKNGNLVVTDTYDFNPIHNRYQSQEAQTGDYGALSPYGWIRNYAGEKIPPGYGRNVRVNLGK